MSSPTLFTLPAWVAVTVLPVTSQKPSSRYIAEAGWSVDLAATWKVVDRHNIAEFEKVAESAGWNSSQMDQILSPVRAGEACMFWPATPVLAKGDLRGCWVNIRTVATPLSERTLRSTKYQQEQWKGLEERLGVVELLSTAVVQIDGVASLRLKASTRGAVRQRVHFVFIPRGKQTLVVQAFVPATLRDRAEPYVDKLLHGFRGAERAPKRDPSWVLDPASISMLAVVCFLVSVSLLRSWWQRRRRPPTPSPAAF